MSSRLARSAGLISLATLASRLLGVGRETVLAYYFGAGTAMDATTSATAPAPALGLARLSPKTGTPHPELTCHLAEEGAVIPAAYADLPASVNLAEAARGGGALVCFGSARSSFP